MKTVGLNRDKSRGPLRLVLEGFVCIKRFTYPPEMFRTAEGLVEYSKLPILYLSNDALKAMP